MSQHDASPDTCQHDTESCATHDRRSFLREGLMAVAALTALGVSADRLQALSLGHATGRRAGDLLRYPMPTADGATIDAEHKVIVARFSGALYAFSMDCPHRGSPIEWQADNNRFFCPKHKSAFQTEGTFIEGKAERNMDRYALRVENGEVVVDTGAMIRSDREAEAWAAAKAAIA